jgi:hypothetical protein
MIPPEVEMMEDIISMARGGAQYAKKNERAKVISQHGNVLIVEAKNGKRFPVHIDKVKKIERT